jgi:cytochrome c oxidase assembly protein subunit 15
VPAYVFNRPEATISIIENPIVIQFIHRSISYLLLILIFIWTIKAFTTQASSAFAKARWFPVGFVLVQITLGIVTVLTSIRIRPARWNIFEWMAQLHQLVAIFLLLSLISALFFLQGQQKAKTKNTVEPTMI